MPFPVFDPDTGARQSIDPRSKHEFALNAHAFTISIEATNYSSGIDFQTSADGGKTWKSIMPMAVKRLHSVVLHIAPAAALLYRCVPSNAVGTVVEIVSP
jgi:hypothetical protein